VYIYGKCIYMGSVNIAVKKEAYEFLKSLKSDSKSFSDVILEFKERKGNKENILKFFGILKNNNILLSEAERNMKRFRRDFEKRVRHTALIMEKNRLK